MDVKNAVIESVRLTADDRGLLSAWLMLDYGGSGQGFGGYALYLPSNYRHHQMLSHAGHFIWRVMEIAGVTEWDKLKGKTIRVRADHGGVEVIGHIIKDDWFCPREDFAEASANAPLQPRTCRSVSGGRFVGWKRWLGIGLSKKITHKRFVRFSCSRLPCG